MAKPVGPLADAGISKPASLLDYSLFGSSLGQWQPSTSALRDSGQVERWDSETEHWDFKSKPWRLSSTPGLIDLDGDYDDGDLFNEDKERQANNDSKTPWLVDFVDDFESLEESMSPNNDIRIMLSGEDEPEEV